MNYIFSILKAYIFFNLLIATPITFIKDIKYGKALPLVFISSVLVLYISQIIFKTFYIGFYLLLLTSLFGLYLLIKNIKNKEFINRYLTSGFYLFIIIILVLAIYNYKREFNVYDEFSHWGHFIKSMYYNNKFYSFDSVSFAHKEYPPFYSLFELLWCYLANSYDEAIITLSIHVFEVSTLFVYYIDTYDKDIKKTLVLMLISALLMISFDYEENTLGSIYVDFPIMLYYAYLFLLTLKLNDKYSFILFVLSLSMYLLTKQVTIALYLVILFLFICLYLKKNREFFIKLGSTIVFPLLCYESWNLVIKDINVFKQFDLSRLDISIIFKGLEGIQKSTSDHYLNSLLSYGLTNGLIKLPYIFISILIIILSIILIKQNKRIKLSIISSIVISIIGYALLMYIMYLFCYSESEMNRLASYSRYIGSFICATLIIVLLLIELDYKYLAILGLLTIISIKPANLIMKTPYFRLYMPSSKVFKDCADSIKEHNNTLVVSNNIGYGNEVIHYCLNDEYQYTYSNELIDYESYDYIYFINYNDLNGLYKVEGDKYIQAID